MVVGQVYAANFLSTLKPKAESKWEPGLFDIDRVRRTDTIAEFDDEVRPACLPACEHALAPACLVPVVMKAGSDGRVSHPLVVGR